MTTLINTNNEHFVERTERLVAERNLETPKGTKSHSSFLSLSDDHIVANVSKLGVMLGGNDSWLDMRSGKLRFSNMVV